MSLPVLNFLIKKFLTVTDIFFPIFLSSMALLILLSAATWTRIISANLWDLLKIYASKFLWKVTVKKSPLAQIFPRSNLDIPGQEL